MDKEDFRHLAVLQDEVLNAFKELKKGDIIFDGTVGKGGHSKLLLNNGFEVIAVDRDKEAIDESKRNLKGFDNIQFVQGNFSNIKEILASFGIEKVKGILLDLGVSTYQLENAERGFGFEGNLDMRMNQNDRLTAKDIVNNYSYEKLKKVFSKNGVKTYVGEVARKIVEEREKKHIEKGEELFEVIREALPQNFRQSRKHHWATPFFRALRIEVNKDFEHLKKFLEEFPFVLQSKGILAIITFHSIEEKIVKQEFQKLKKEIKLLTRKGIVATNEEIKKNLKEKRAKLWIAIKR